MNLAAVIEPHPADSVALVNRGRTTTYGELREQVGRLRGALVGLGLAPGDRVGLICGNNGYFVTGYLATLGAGLVSVPLNPSSPPKELQRELAAVSARAVIVGPAGRAAFDALDAAAVPALEHRILVDALPDSDPGPIVEREPSDLAVLMFTSGTAGSPKAAMLTHGNLTANLHQMQEHPGRMQSASDVTLGVLPLFHIFGLNVVLGMSLYVGARVVLIERFDPVSAIEAIRTHEVTIVPGAPSMWIAWAAAPEATRAAFASVRLAASGAAKLPLEVAEDCEQRFGVTVSEGYGLTEASPVVTTAAGAAAKPGSIGTPLPGVRLRLVDGEGEDVLVGDAGELWVQGPNVFAGYWNDAAATATVMTSDGWLRTGDIGVVDDDGALFLVDRAKDLIIVSGFNVYPAEVEDVILQHPAVEACAVVGVAHPYSGESVKAFVVVTPGQHVEEDSIIAFCSDHLARYKCPEKVMFVEELPVGIGGKVLRRALR
ncbi:MAG TPA: long-chain fatty acid--CoA ligase [Acidimicrobiales bacterium]|nr:long-chain fatty acid--CoA ligase [Acidimicrobiales bacterium]